MNAQKISLNIINREEINSTFRIISDSDLDIESENKNSRIFEINEYNKNDYQINNIRNINNLNNEKNNIIHNENNNILIYNINNNENMIHNNNNEHENVHNNNNEANIDNQNNNDINDDNNSNNSDNYDAFYIKNEKMNKHNDLVQELKNQNFIFIKDYPEQKLNKINKKYTYWIQNIYLKIHSFNDNIYNKFKTKIKYELPDYPKLLEEIKENLFFCNNPKCKSVIYLSKNISKKFKKIPDIYLFENAYDDIFLTGYEKQRCPLCLIYRCKFCKRLSTLKSSFCCPLQAYKACYDTNDIEYSSEYCIKLAIKAPIVRVWYFGFMTNFPFFRALTKTHKIKFSYLSHYYL